MAITLGSFTFNTLTAQPFGYEGDPRFGRTAQIVRIVGLLTPTQWQTLLNVYNTWRNQRINDPDSTVSKDVGTTVAVSASGNGVAWSNVLAWFTEAPSAEQLGAYVQVTATVVNALEALQVLIEENGGEEVDCAKITADLHRRKAEIDCELAALAAGLANAFAEQDVTRELLDGNARLNARASDAQTLATIPLLQDAQDATARKAAFANNPSALLQIAAGELGQQSLQDLARASAYESNADDVFDVEDAALRQELVTNQQRVLALAARLDVLKASRNLLSLYDKYLQEDLPDLGSISLGGVTIKYIQPPDTRADGPTVALTATGRSYISGPLTAHAVKQVNGIITQGTYSDLLAWYDEAIAGSGSPFPTQPPTATAEPFLIGGLKDTRYTVNLTLTYLN
jgi:hypothetical protein